MTGNINIYSTKQRKIIDSVDVCNVCGIPAHFNWLRGLSLIDNMFVVGVCENAERQKRAKSESYLLFFDKNLSYIKKQQLNYGSLLDLRCLNCIDKCNNSIKFDITR
jgi:hypothetical protein